MNWPKQCSAEVFSRHFVLKGQAPELEAPELEALRAENAQLKDRLQYMDEALTAAKVRLNR